MARDILEWKSSLIEEISILADLDDLRDMVLARDRRRVTTLTEFLELIFSSDDIRGFLKLDPSQSRLSVVQRVRLANVKDALQSFMADPGVAMFAGAPPDAFLAHPKWIAASEAASRFCAGQNMSA